MLRRIFSTPPLSNHVVRELMPGDAYSTDEQILAFIRETGDTTHHWSGTCKMGPDSMAVVDERLRVHSIESLRVADASIMPRVTSGNINGPTIMIGEKAASMIRADRQG
jgi:choline dehydrogenase